MAITSIPTRDSTSIGGTKTDDGAPPNRVNFAPADEYNEVLARVVEIYSEVGLTDGSTPNSIRALLKNANTSVSKLNAEAAPSTNDDGVNTSGNGLFSYGSLWVDTVGKKAYVLVDPTTNAAVWQAVGMGDLATALAALTGDYTIGAAGAFSNINVGDDTTSISITDGLYVSGSSSGGQMDVTVSAEFHAGATLDGASVAGALSLDDNLSPAQITSDQVDYNPTNWTRATGVSVLRVNTDAPRALKSLNSNTVSGGLVFIYNIGSYRLTLRHDFTSGTTARARFSFPGGKDVYVDPGDCVVIRFDNATLRWTWVAGGKRGRRFANGGAPITTATYTIKPEDEVIHVDTTSNAVALTAAALDGVERLIQKVGGGTNGITLVRTGSENVNGVAATYTLPSSDVAFDGTAPQGWLAYDDGAARWVT